MPIDYKKYDPTWKTEIRPRILERAGNCCETCGVKNKSVYIMQDGQQVFLERKGNSNFWLCPDGYGRLTGRTGEWTLKQVVLTISHQNHDTSDNNDLNLKALCQRCHNAHDQKYRMENVRLTRNRKKGLIAIEF